jgi:hypothetical protein
LLDREISLELSVIAWKKASLSPYLREAEQFTMRLSRLWRVKGRPQGPYTYTLLDPATTSSTHQSNLVYAYTTTQTHSHFHDQDIHTT